MSGALTITIALGLYCLYRSYKESQEAKEAEEERFFQELMSDKDSNNGKQDAIRNNMGARDLVFDTLTKMGCQYSIDEENNNRINFSFQGEQFVIDASNDILMIDIWDLWWAEYELYDIDGFSRLKRAINDANINTSLTTVYSVNEAGSTIGVHSHKSILFIQQIPNVESYLQAMLSDFFRVHRYIATALEKIKVEEESAR